MPKLLIAVLVLVVVMVAVNAVLVQKPALTVLPGGKSNSGDQPGLHHGGLG